MFKLRHPTICKFYSKYNRCKFDPCKHEQSEIDNIKKENMMIDTLDVIKKDINRVVSSNSRMGGGGLVPLHRG